MPAFRYTAVDRTGLVQHGILDAASEAAVIEHLQAQGQIPMRTAPAGVGAWWQNIGLPTFLTRSVWGGAERLRPRDLTYLTRELAVMLAAGMDLDRALRFIVETAAKPRLIAVMTQLRDAVRGGSDLATALGQQPQSFPRLYVGLIRAGEAGGTLAATLERLAVMLEREHRLGQSIQAALIYPAILVLTALGSITVLLTTVLPEFTPLFAESGAELPMATRWLIALGDGVSAGLPFLLPVLAVLGLASHQALKDPAIRRGADRALLRLPILGAIARETLAARFSRTLGTLLVNGVALLPALAILRDVLGNLAAIDAVDAAIDSAKTGMGLSRALDQSGLFPARMVHLLRLGEETARLGPLALSAAEIHEEQAGLKLQQVTALLVPAITITMGAAVAGIIAALLSAMLSLNDLAG